MPLILNIDTATETASVCLNNGTHVLAFKECNEQKEHASFLHATIRDIFIETGKDLNECNAIAVSAGPGSYTGLRVGLAAAKGFCYALKIPLILVDTLKVMAQAAAAILQEKDEATNALLCPMIDARRMEVFTALFDKNLNEVMPATNLILDETSFTSYLKANKIYFFGNGSQKLNPIVNSLYAIFLNIKSSAINVGMLSTYAYENNLFSDVAYSEPNYVKEFYSTQANK